MKKAFSFVLLFIYLLPAIGFSMDVHWCGKKISAVHFIISENKCACDIKAKSSCCRDVHTFIKLKDDQQHAPQIVVAHAQCLKSLPASENKNGLSYFPLSCSYRFTAHSPPCVARLPVYLENSVFRI